MFHNLLINTIKYIAPAIFIVSTAAGILIVRRSRELLLAFILTTLLLLATGFLVWIALMEWTISLIPQLLHPLVLVILFILLWRKHKAKFRHVICSIIQELVIVGWLILFLIWEIIMSSV